MAKSHKTTWTPLQKSYIFWRFLANATTYLTMCAVPVAFVAGVNALAEESTPWLTAYFAVAMFCYYCYKMWAVYQDRSTVYCAAVLFCENSPPTYAAEVAALTHKRNYYRSLAVNWNPIAAPFRLVYLILRWLLTSGREINAMKLA